MWAHPQATNRANRSQGQESRRHHSQKVAFYKRFSQNSLSLNLDVGRKNLSITKPSFILDEKQSQHYGIKYGRPFTSYQKNQPVNFAEIATASNTTRDIAESAYYILRFKCSRNLTENYMEL